MENISDFDFYLKFAKPLILNLPQINDRVLAAAWVKKLAGDSNADEKTKLDYLKLLLFVLQRKRLAAPFTQHPNAVDALVTFHPDQSLVDVAKAIIEHENFERRDKLERQKAGESGDYPPYVSDFSADLFEYVAVQNIDNFGVHGYYAISKLPLGTWYRIDKQLLPKAAKSMLEVSTAPPTFAETQSSPDLTDKPPAEEPQQPPEPERIQSPRKKKSTLGASPPSRPIGKVTPPTEEREPPTWGSNLLEAKLMGEDLGAGIDDEEIPEMFQSPAPMEVLWPSPGRTASANIFQDDEFPFDFGGEGADLDTSMPELVGDEDAYTSAASLPPSPQQPPPPPLSKRPPKKKVAPKPRPTRASLLLQKKAELARQPPPPPAKKAPPKRGPRGSKTSRSSTSVPEEVEQVPSKKKLAKRPSKAASAKQRREAPRDATADEVDEYVAAYDQALQELAQEFRSEMAAHPEAIAGPSGTSITEAKVKKPKRQLSKLAKAKAKTIPKSHKEPTELEQSIHISPVAREIYQDILGDTSSASHPVPRLPPGVIEEQEEQHDEVEAVEEAEAGAVVPADYASDVGPSGHGVKDPRLIDTYNRMVDISTQEGDVEEDDYEAMERMLEEEMRKVGLDPHARQRTPPQPAQAKAQYLGVHKRAEEQMAKLGRDVEEDDFEATERMLEEEMRREGLDPHARQMKQAVPTQAMAQYLDVYRRADDQLSRLDAPKRPQQILQAIAAPAAARKYRPPLSPVYEEDEEEKEEWMPADEFFEHYGDRERREFRPPYPHRQMVPPEYFESLERRTLEDLGVLPEDLLEDEFAKTDAINQMYQDFVYADPAFAGVPVTSPRLSASPHRPAGAAKGPLADILDVSPEEEKFGLPEVTATAHVEDKPLRKLVRPTIVVHPASPPQTEEELAVFPGPSIVDTFPPESYQFQYTSPGRQVLPMLPVPVQTHEDVSPPNRRWYFELDALHDRLYGTTQTTPTIFDFPADRIAGETPPRLYSPVRSPGTPPIDVAKLKRDIAEKAHILSDWDYSDRVGELQTWIDRHPERVQMDTIHEEPDHLTEEDLNIHRKIKDFDYADVPERRRFQFPFKHKQRVLKRHAPAPQLSPLGEVYESPERQKIYPDVFDLPDLEALGLESPPKDILVAGAVTPASAEIDWDKFRQDVRAGTIPVAEKQELRRRSRAPQLAAVPQRREWQKLPAPYDRSPVSSRQYVGPKPRSIRKQLRKRRLDFSAPPDSHNENQLEMTDVYTEIEDEYPPEEEDDVSPGVYAALKKIREEAEAEGTPRTPDTRMLHQVEIPDVGELPEFSPQEIDVLGQMEEPAVEDLPEFSPLQTDILGQVEAPDVEDLPEFYPLSPMSQFDVMKGILDKAKAYRPPEQQPKRPRYLKPRRRPVKGREFYRRYPWRKLEDIGEYEIDESPPHHRQLFGAQRAIDLGAEEMPEGFALPGRSPVQMQPLVMAPPPAVSPEQEELEEFERFERLTQSPRRQAPAAAAHPMARVAGMTEAQFAALAASPPRPAQIPIDVIAGRQYAALRPTHVAGEVSPEAAAMMYYRPTLTSPEMRSMQPSPQPQLVEFDYVETVREHKPEKTVKAAKALRAVKAGKGVPPPKAGKRAAPPKRKEVPPPKGKGKLVKSQKSVSSITSRRSDGSVVSQRSEKSVRSQRSDQSLGRPRRKKYNVQSKLDTGRKKKKPAEPLVETEYDLAALQELGVTEADLRNLNLDDLEVDVAQLEAGPPVRRRQLKRPPGQPVPASVRGKRGAQAIAAPAAGRKASQPAQQMIPKPKRAKYNVVSKLDTGRRPVKKPVAAQVAVPAELQVEAPVTQLDVEPVQEPRGRRRPRAPSLPALAETEEEYGPTSPMKLGDMKWHMSPQSRVDRRIPDVKALPSPLRPDQRIHYERVVLQSPERQQQLATRPIPANIDVLAMYPELAEDYYLRPLQDAVDEGLVGTEQPELEEAFPEIDVVEEMSRRGGPVYQLEEEGAPAGVYLPPPGPSPIRRKIPVRAPPVSPSHLRAELETHELYDPNREQMTRRVHVRGKYRPLLDAQKPGISPIYEGTPPKTAPVVMPTTPEQLAKVAASVQAAENQYADLLAPSPLRKQPTPPTPSPKQLRRMVDQYEYDPRIYTKKFGRKRRPRLKGPSEEYEYISPDFRIAEGLHVHTPVHEESPPFYYSPPTPPGAMAAFPDIDTETPPAYTSPQFVYSPPPVRVPSPAFRNIDVESPPTPYESPIIEHVQITETEKSPIDPRYREMMPSPQLPARLIRHDVAPDYFDTHGLPAVDVYGTPPMPPTPRRTPVPRAERKLVKRRLDFGQLMPTPRRSPVPKSERQLPRRRLDFGGTPEKSPVRLLTVEASPFDIGVDEADLGLEEEPSFLQALSPPPLLPPEMLESEAPPMMYGAVSPAGIHVPPEEDIPEDQEGFKWLGAYKAPDLPWEPNKFY